MNQKNIMNNLCDIYLLKENIGTLNEVFEKKKENNHPL